MENVYITTKEKEVQRALGTLGIWIFNIFNPHPYPHDVYHLCVEAPTMLIARGLAQKFCKNSKGKYSVEHMFRNSGDTLTHMGYKPIEVIALSPGESSTPQWLANVLTDDIAGWNEYVICERAATISGYRCVALRLYCDGVKVKGC